MDIRRFSFLLARAYFCLFVLLTSFYCLLSYIPFSYHWFIKFSPVAWLPEFARLHHLFWFVAIVVVIPTLVAPYRVSKTRNMVRLFVLLCLISAALLLAHPFLTSVPNDYRAFSWSLLSLFPMVWLATIDLLSVGSAAAIGSEQNSFPVMPALAAGVFVSFTYSISSFVRFGLVDDLPFGRAELFGALWSLFAHL